MKRPRRRLVAHLRYLVALAKRFRVTLILVGILFLVLPHVYIALYVKPDGHRIGYGEALHHIYFLLFGQPSLEYVDNALIEVLNLLIPPFGVAIIVDGVVRFAYLYFAKHRDDKEWVAVMSQTFRDHVIVCGAGRVGYRVTTQLLALGREVVVIDKAEAATFVSTLRDQGVPVLIDDINNPKTLSRTNAKGAAAIVCATNDDLANLNVALDARMLNPSIRVVIRLFDDDLVARVRDNFRAEALSTSSLSAPAFALAALDPRIVHSFHVGAHLMVVSQFTAIRGLPGMTIGELRDRFGGLTLAIRRAGKPEELHPRNEVTIAQGEVLTVQSTYEDYRRLRELTDEKAPPLSAHGS
ncbi:MAG: NAD-binding protein [Myxococcales bacterium]|nr:NAD-binding protein [Myxococcales bacterium]